MESSVEDAGNVILGLIPVLIFLLPLIVGSIFIGIQKKFQMNHSESGLNKNGFYGYCWTYFIFGAFVPIFRGEIGIGLLHLLFTVLTFGIFWLVMPFLYNKQYTSRLLTSGYRLADSEENNSKAREKLGISEQPV